MSLAKRVLLILPWRKSLLLLTAIHSAEVFNVDAGTYPAKTIAIIGSSTAAGTGASSYAHAWAGLYTAYLTSLNSSNKVVNLAVAGYTTYHELPSGTSNPVDRPAVDTAHNITAALATHPDAVIINLPSNDAANAYSESETETNFLKMAAACLTSNVPVWIATTQPRDLSSVGRTNLIDVREWIISAFPTRYLDFWTTVANSDGSINTTFSAGDGIHLNNAGHQVLYSRVVASRLYERTFAPVFESVNKADGRIEFVWSAPPGKATQLQYISDLTSSSWTNVGSAVMATNGIMSAFDILTPVSARLYRLLLVP